METVGAQIRVLGAGGEALVRVGEERRESGGRMDQLVGLLEAAAEGRGRNAGVVAQDLEHLGVGVVEGEEDDGVLDRLVQAVQIRQDDLVVDAVVVVDVVDLALAAAGGCCRGGDRRGWAITSSF